MRATIVPAFILGAALVLPAIAVAAPEDDFKTFLTGPWGQSTTSGEPMSALTGSASSPEFTRKSCPADGVAIADMVDNEVWFDTQSGKFGRHSGGKSPSWTDLTFVRMANDNVAQFKYFAPSMNEDATLTIERLSDNLIKATVAVSVMQMDTYYARCKPL